ncbi:MAG: trehalose-phosphatase [Gemmatimonadota bacterium]|nr:trehalose-phosphatase [Gemmatimonadota bacterium]
MSELDAALARLAAKRRLLVASDFDGTLAPIADHPDAVQADSAACAALADLATLPDTDSVVISGRELAVLHGLLGEHARALRLVGSHGAERGSGEELSTDEAGARDRIAADFDVIAARTTGALVERKPFGVAFHYRRVPEATRAALADDARAAVRAAGLSAQEGHMVVEAVVAESDKGTALEALREELGATGVFFIGDDVTDERAFERLGPGDLGVKVGPGETIAAHRVEAQPEVARVLSRLRDLREGR